jgi:hypothetical protein
MAARFFSSPAFAGEVASRNSGETEGAPLHQSDRNTL